jgi:hypothetical protein
MKRNLGVFSKKDYGTLFQGASLSGANVALISQFLSAMTGLSIVLNRKE